MHGDSIGPVAVYGAFHTSAGVLQAVAFDIAHKTLRNECTDCPKCATDRSQLRHSNLLTLTQRTFLYAIFEVFAAVTMKNGVFWAVMPCASCKNRRFGRT
jgi:hypothetical protein